MALLGNNSVLLKNPISNIGGDSVSGVAGLNANWNTPGQSRNRFYGENLKQGTADRYGLPAGYAAPYSWRLPPKAGGVGSTTGVKGASTMAGSGALGVNVNSTISGVGGFSDAGLGLILSAVATIGGIGGLSADVVGKLDAAATMAGNSNMSGALGALAGAIATLSGTSGFVGDVVAKANVSADIFVNQGTATVNEIVRAVWSALAAEFNESGTMGNKLNGAGNAGDPWTTDLDSYTTEGTAGKILKDAKKKATLAFYK